jgi:hypothetical protein
MGPLFQNLSFLPPTYPRTRPTVKRYRGIAGIARSILTKAWFSALRLVAEQRSESGLLEMMVGSEGFSDTTLFHRDK